MALTSPFPFNIQPIPSKKTQSLESKIKSLPTCDLWTIQFLTKIYEKRKIRSIIKKGGTPLIVQLSECPIEHQFKEEYRWIKGAICKYKLTNIIQ